MFFTIFNNKNYKRLIIKQLYFYEIFPFFHQSFIFFNEY